MPWWSKKIYWKEGKKIEAEISTQAQGPGGWIQLWRLLGRQLLRCTWQLRLRWRLWWSSSNEDIFMSTMIHSLSLLLCFNWDVDEFHLMFGQMIIFGCKPLNLEQDLFPGPWVILNVFFSQQHQAVVHMFFWHNVSMIMIVMMMMGMVMIDDDMLHLSSSRMAPRVSLAPFVTLRPICASLAP